MAHRDAVADTDGGELDRRAPGAPDARLDRIGERVSRTIDSAEKQMKETGAQTKLGSWS